MKLSACIVVYNGYDEALKAAQTVLHCTRRYPVTLYLVDNASPDGSGKKLEQAVADGLLAAGPGQHVVVHCRTENGGFGTGHNMILPELDSDFHFILNPDIQLTADTLSDLADWMAAHPDAVMARPSLVFPDGKPQQLPLRRCALRPMLYRQLPRLSFWKGQNDHYLMLDEDLTRPIEIEFCTGSFSGVRTSTFKAVGGLTRATSCMWRMRTSPRRCAPGARCIWCLSIPPSTPGTALPTGISSPPSGRRETC